MEKKCVIFPYFSDFLCVHRYSLWFWLFLQFFVLSATWIWIFNERLRYSFPQCSAFIEIFAENAKKFKYHLVTRQDQNKSFPATLLSSVRKIEVILGEQEREKKMAFLFWSDALLHQHGGSRGSPHPRRGPWGSQTQVPQKSLKFYHQWKNIGQIESKFKQKNQDQCQ